MTSYNKEVKFLHLGSGK